MKKISLILISLILSGFCYASELSKQATAFYSDNNNTRTMDLILQINEKDRTAQDWLLLGNVLQDNGETENAVYMYNKAIDADKKCYKAYYNLGNYYVSIGQFEQAVKYYKKAISIKYDNPYIYYNLGCTYIKLKEYPKARAAFNKAIMYKSDVPEFHYNLSYVYKQLGNTKLMESYAHNYEQLTKQE